MIKLMLLVKSESSAEQMQRSRQLQLKLLSKELDYTHFLETNGI